MNVNFYGQGGSIKKRAYCIQGKTDLVSVILLSSLHLSFTVQHDMGACTVRKVIRKTTGGDREAL